MAKYLGLDVGRARVGLALADLTSGVAVPLAVFDLNADFWARLRDLCQKEAVERIVVGWPVGLDGQNSGQTEMVVEFVQELKKQLPEAIVECVDERLSSKATNLASNNDAQAATLILNNYLERQL